jgi:hypothetical protein
MGTAAESQAEHDAARLRSVLASSRRNIPAMAGDQRSSLMCRADAWTARSHTLDGDYALDDPVGQQLLRSLVAQRPEVADILRSWEPKAFVAAAPAAPAARAPSAAPPAQQRDWFSEYVLGDWGGHGVESEVVSAAVSPTNVLGNAVGAAGTAQVALQRTTQLQTMASLKAGAQRVASGGARTVVINEHMELYNANHGKGRPRVRLRIRGLKIAVLEPIAPEEAWRAGAKGAVQSMRWAQPVGAEMRAAGMIAGNTKWGSSLGKLAWATTKWGGGVLAFAPSLALDTYNSVQTQVDASGQRHVKFDSHGFAVRSATSQSGNALGFAAGVGVGILAGAALAATWPVLLIGLGAGIAVQVVWNSSGMAAETGNWVDHHVK